MELTVPVDGGHLAAFTQLGDLARVRGLLLLAPGVQDYPWPEDDPYGKRFGELGVRTWAAAGDGRFVPAGVARAPVGGRRLLGREPRSCAGQGRRRLPSVRTDRPPWARALPPTCSRPRGNHTARWWRPRAGSV